MDMAELYEMVLSGMSNAEIISVNQDYILHLSRIDQLRTTILTERYKNNRRIDLQVTYVSGVTGTGKTRDILDEYGDANVYRVTDYQHPFDQYACQEVLVFETNQTFLLTKHIKGTYDVIDKFIVVIRGRTTTRAEAGLFRCAIYGLAIL